MAAANAKDESLLGKEKYSFAKRIEYGGIVAAHLPKVWSWVFYVILLLYMVGVICIHCIETATNVSTIFSIMIYGETGGVSYNLVLGIFFACVFLLSMKNIANVKILGYIIIVLKITVIIIYIIGGTYTIVEYGAM